MEVREYWRILVRRWRVIVALTLLVGVISAVQMRPWRSSPPTYQANLSMLIGVVPVAGSDVTAYDPRYYAWLTSEYLVDDFTEVVESQLFAAGINQRLAEAGIEIPAGAISGSAATSRQHRVMHLSLSWPDAGQLETIADAAVAELEQNATYYFRQLGSEDTVVTLLERPVIRAVSPALRSRLEFPLRLFLAAVIGIALAFWLEYLDTSVRNAEDLEALGLTVLGAIPRR